MRSIFIVHALFSRDWIPFGNVFLNQRNFPQLGHHFDVEKFANHFAPRIHVTAVGMHFGSIPGDLFFYTLREKKKKKFSKFTFSRPTRNGKINNTALLWLEVFMSQKGVHASITEINLLGGKHTPIAGIPRNGKKYSNCRTYGIANVMRIYIFN